MVRRWTWLAGDFRPHQRRPVALGTRRVTPTNWPIFRHRELHRSNGVDWLLHLFRVLIPVLSEPLFARLGAVELIECHTDRIDEVEAIMREWVDAIGSARTARWADHDLAHAPCRDR